MNNITDFLDQLQKLTNRNLEILQALNESFYTKKNHLTVNIGDVNYVIPSFISLENKINTLQETLHNLVYAPTTGEAFINMDGNSRQIEVRGYTHTPNSIKMDVVNNFGINQNSIFKDFLTPIPYINVDLKTIPNDITTVNIKKVVPINIEIINKFKEFLGESASVQYKWSDLYKILSLYKKDVDYIEYNTVKKLPIRKNIGSGIYVIENILEDYVDQINDNLDNYIRLKLRNNLPEPYINDLSYRLFDETIYKQLQVGDELVTFDDSAKMQIMELDSNTNTILVKVLNGEYLNLGQTNLIENESVTGISDSCKIKFYSPIDFDSDKYIQIPLEEDQYIFTSISALNDRMNIQSPWGTGLILNTSELTLNGDDSIKFSQYYEENVRNIGDILFEITSSMSNTVTTLTPQEFETITNAIPVINSNNIEVVQVNKHLNNSKTVQNIRSLYSQKNLYKTELNELQTKIDSINKELASISFDDTSGLRPVYTAQLTEYNTKKNELVTSISKIIDEISLEANNSEIPIENAKYRIRGFFDYNDFSNNIGNIAIGHIKGIKLFYRYKNLDQPQGDAQTINDTFLFSDWNIMDSFLNPKIVKYNNKYEFINYPDNDNSNEPSFNQIDIPITQGETVDIKLKVIYDYGYPFTETTSKWSDIINIKFPEEFLKNIQILDIIEENNNDIETNRFNNIIKEQGIPDHINDKIIDQDLTYFHRPENISSGFYTEERRIIPLKDKLSEMNNIIIGLQDEILGTSSDALTVSIVNGVTNNELLPYQTNNISVESYNIFANQIDNELIADGIYDYDSKTGIVSTVLNIVLSNTSQHTVKLYSLFPGSRDNSIGDLKSNNVKFNQSDYQIEQNGVWVNYDKDEDTEFKLQTANQFITFRINDPFNGEKYYKENASTDSSLLPSDLESIRNGFDISELHDGSKLSMGILMYPKIREEFSICTNNDNIKSYVQLAPGADMIIPISFEYRLRDIGGEENNTLNAVSKTMSFDIRTSLYEDPTNYTFKVTAKLNNTTQDKLIKTNRKYITETNYKSIVTK